jgi:hypothetical protein
MAEVLFAEHHDMIKAIPSAGFSQLTRNLGR